MILGDILLLNPMRTLGLLKNKEFCVSYFYLTGHYLSSNEKLILKELKEKGCIEIFELDSSFYRFYNQNINENFALTELSSIFQAKQTNMPLVSKCDKIKIFADKIGVTVYEPDMALGLINVGQDRINFLNTIMRIA